MQRAEPKWQYQPSLFYVNIKAIFVAVNIVLDGYISKHSSESEVYTVHYIQKYSLYQMG